MLKTSFLLFLLPLMFLSCTPDKKETVEVSSHGSESETYYTCSMHPEVHEHRPGSCPICGMPLIKAQKNELKPSDDQKKNIHLESTRAQRHDVEFKLSVAGKILNSNEVIFYIYEVDRPFLKPGLKFQGRGAGGKELSFGVITSIDHMADPSSRTVRAVGKITGGEKLKIMEGSFFGKIISPEKDLLMIPIEAVLHTGKKDIVYLVKSEGKMVPQEVILGRSQGEEVEVIDGLSDGEEIAAGPNFLLDSEARLRGLND